MHTFALILGTALLIAACGTKGPLTLPPTPAPNPAPNPSVAAPDASTKAEPGR